MILPDLRRLNDLLQPHDRRHLALLGLLIVVATLLQLVSLAAIYSFLASLASAPTQLPTWLRQLTAAAGVRGERASIVLFALACFALLLLANMTTVLVERAKLRAEARLTASMSTRLLEIYLERDYPFFVREHSSRLSKNVLHGVREVTVNIFRPALDLASKATISLAILALLVAIDPFVSLAVAVVVAAGFSVIYFAMQGWVRLQGRVVGDAQREKIEVVGEAMGGIKEIKVLGRESDFVRRFDLPARRMADAQTSVEFSLSLNRYALEIVAFGSILFVVSWMVLRGATFASIVPIVGLLGIAGYRLMPAMRDISTAISAFAYGSPALQEIWHDFQQAPPTQSRPRERLRFQHSLSTDGLGFAYGSEAVLHDITLDIRAGQAIAFAGASGAGKSTFADLVMGLIRPTTGRILVDGVALDEGNIPRWQRNIGYVPQEIFLADATIAQNIAFGVPLDQLDLEAVRRAARLAQVATFIDSLPQGYHTRVGERGVRLSGGQRQRIGIARALYEDPPVLVMDEATSDVDGATEASIAAAVRELAGSKTVLMIAHRTTAMRTCDTIYFLEKGRIAAVGPYDELVQSHAGFRRTVEALDG